ncbi:hypothetical protein JTB14_037987 [Gonioctena quinquepunctata]|nr:hypothetical protein JTB14_037987 [Gonioctena quinquepunctata]
MIKALQSDYQNHINRATPSFSTQHKQICQWKRNRKKPLEKANTSRKSEKEAQEQNNTPNINVAEVDFTIFINSNQNFEEEIAQVKIEEKNIDIFNIGNQFALAHCISADGKLGAGIAKSFDNIFSLGEEIKESRPITGSVITTKRNGRIIYVFFFYEEEKLEVVSTI